MSHHIDERVQDDARVLVLGGTGRTGRRVATRLRASGAPTRIGSRSGAPPFHWQDRSTWPAAVQGASAAYVSYYPDLAVPGAADAVADLVALAARSGVRRVVLLSGRGEAEAQRAEEAARAAAAGTGTGVTVVRASWFAQNFSESFLLEGVLTGTVALPVGAVREPFVDVEDIADVAVAALTQGEHGSEHDGRLYEVTGPRLLTFAEAVEEVSEASGRPVRYECVPAAQWTAGLAGQGLPQGVVGLLTHLFAEVLDGRNASLTDGVHQALGRAPRDFADYARATAATGVWGAPAAVTR